MLSGKQKRYLRGLGHHREAIVQVGKEGVTDGLVAAVTAALDDHELVKLRLGESVHGDRHEVAETIARAAGADLVQVIGRTVLVYRPRDEDPAIRLPG